MRSGDGYLSKREQQIMEAIYAQERVTAAEICELLPGAPTNATVRTLLRILEEKGHLTHVDEGGRFVYSAAEPRQSAARQALGRVVDTFFRGSVTDVVAALLKEDRQKLTPDEIERLQTLVDQARQAG